MSHATKDFPAKSPTATPPLASATDVPPRPAAGLLLSQPQAWRFVGVSRTKWFALRSAGKVPPPVNLDGFYWRRADLEEFVSRLKPVRGRRARMEAAAMAGE